MFSDFTKLQKQLLVFLMSLCLCLCMEQLSFHWMDFVKFDI
jgi:hypothetical protein